MSKTLICLVGMPGAGKSWISRILQNEGLPAISMGDIVLKEAKTRDLTPNGHTLRNLMVQMRKEKGPRIVAELCVPLLDRISSDVIVVDGLRTPEELHTFKERYKNVVLIGVSAPKSIRFRRLLRDNERNRLDNPTSLAEFEKRERLELNLGLKEILAAVNYRIENDGDEGKLREDALELLSLIRRTSKI